MVDAAGSAQSGELFPEKGSGEHHHESPTNTSIFSETPRHDDDISLCIASPKEPVFPETIPEEASSIEEEHVLLFRLPQGPDPIFYTADASLLHQSHFQTPSSRRSSRSSLHSKDRTHDRYTTKFDFDKIEQFERKHDEAQKPKGSSSTERESVETDPKSPQYQKSDQKGYIRQRFVNRRRLLGMKFMQCKHFSHYDIAAATFLDVAVLRCLFVSHWQEEGVYWSLHYLYNR